MEVMQRLAGLIPAVCVVLTAAACASSPPAATEDVPYQERTQTKQKGNLRVTAAVLSAEESQAVFGVPLYEKEIQPIWLEIRNDDPEPVWFLPTGLDAHYFTPLEAAYMFHSRSRQANAELDRLFRDLAIGMYVAPGEVRSGFVLTNLDEGTKDFVVELFGWDQELRGFTFFIPVPGLRVDHASVDFTTLYSPDEIADLDDAGLRKALEDLPCCTTNKKATGQGDPLNLVVIGEPQDVFYAFIRAGWDETETIYGGSTRKTIRSFLFGGRYRYSPVSGLYVFGRPQDIALQKARESIHERNHLRLWLAPMRLEGKPVWIGQISRDIGVRFTRKTITTHKIDPDVDETRDFLLQDMLYSQGLSRYGYAKGVGAAPISEPRGNLTGDPYFTDGHRAVMWLSGDLVSMEDLRFADWGTPHAQ